MLLSTRRLAALGAAATLSVGAVVGVSTSAQAAPAPRQALTLSESGTRMTLIRDINTPKDDYPLGSIVGLSGDSRLVGIDQRPKDGKVYAVGNNGGIYTISFSFFASASKVSQLSSPLSGSDFGVDFNPAADRLRVISNTGQNLRINVDTGGVTVDGTLSYSPIGSESRPVARGVTAAAYTNSDNDPNTATTLFDIDTKKDQVVTQTPPNDGTLVKVKNIGFDADIVAGFDILTVGTSNLAYAALREEGSRKTRLYNVDLVTGKVTGGKAMAGGVGSTGNVADIAILSSQPFPA